MRDGTLSGAELLALLGGQPLELRDQLLEEILDIAYPREEDAELIRELIPYAPSGLSEIRFMLERSGLAPGKTFVDLGSGLGKVVMLVAFLTGARAVGIESQAHFVNRARAAANALALGNADFVAGDLRSVELPPADVYYMFIPFVRPTEAVARLRSFAEKRKILLFSERLDSAAFPWLRRRDEGCYWLETYEGDPALFAHT